MKRITKLQFTIIEEIGGEGLNSKAWLAHDPQLNTNLVIKGIEKKDFKTIDEYFHESKVLYHAKHPNIMELNYASQDDTMVYMAMPYYKNGSLNSIIESKFLTVREIIKYSLDYLGGLLYIHTKGLIHFDVKPSNIIINNSNKALLSDFGLSNYVDINGFASVEKVYPTHWVPEAFQTTDLTVQYDIYQAGLTLYRMCNGNDIFKKQVELVEDSCAITEGIFPNREVYLPHIPNKLSKCINKALEVNPDNRYKSVLELMNDISSINENLDWKYFIDESKEIWIIENDKTIRELLLYYDNGKWKTEGYMVSKNTRKKSKINPWFSENNLKNKSLNTIRKIIKTN